MDSLRAKQNMEILDVFKNLNSQIVGLENRQVQAFPETLKPKTQRDLDVEVSVDKGVEHLNRVLEDKLGALEYLVQNVELKNQLQGELASKDTRGTFQKSLDSVSNTGDAIPQFNSIVRSYQQPGLSRESQNIVQVKAQDLQPNLDAMCFGLRQAVDLIFGGRSFHSQAGNVLYPKIGLAILDLLRSLSIYKTMKQQVESGQFEFVTVELMDRAYKNIFDSLSVEQVRLLKLVSNKAVPQTSIRNVPIFSANPNRIKDLESELGFKLPRDTTQQLRTVSVDEFNRVAQQMRNEAHAFVQDGHNTADDGQISHLQAQMDVVQREKAHVESAYVRLQLLVDGLEEGEEYEFKSQPLPEVGLPPDVGEFGTPEYTQARDSYDEAVDARNEVELNNRLVEIYEHYEMGDEATHQQVIDDLKEELLGLENSSQELEQRRIGLEKQAKKLGFTERLSKQVGRVKINLPQAANSRGEGKPHKGLPIDTRGIASLRKNYGFESQSDSDSESGSDSSSDDENPLAYNDSKNDMFTSKPYDYQRK